MHKERAILMPLSVGNRLDLGSGSLLALVAGPERRAGAGIPVNDHEEKDDTVHSSNIVHVCEKETLVSQIRKNR